MAIYQGGKGGAGGVNGRAGAGGDAGTGSGAGKGGDGGSVYINNALLWRGGSGGVAGVNNGHGNAGEGPSTGQNVDSQQITNTKTDTQNEGSISGGSVFSGWWKRYGL